MWIKSTYCLIDVGIPNVSGNAFLYGIPLRSHCFTEDLALSIRKVNDSATVIFDLFRPGSFVFKRVIGSSFGRSSNTSIQDRFIFVRKAVVEVEVDEPLLGLLQVVGERDILLLLIELLRINQLDRILLRVDSTLLKRGVKLIECKWG